MSNVYNKNDKELAGVKVVSSDDVFVYNNKTNRKDKIRSDLDIIGKVDMDMPNLVIKANKEGNRTDYIEDVSSLPKRCKKDLVSHFYDDKGKRNRRKKAYLVRTDKQSKTATKATKANKPKNKK